MNLWWIRTTRETRADAVDRVGPARMVPADPPGQAEEVMARQGVEAGSPGGGLVGLGRRTRLGVRTQAMVSHPASPPVVVTAPV